MRVTTIIFTTTAAFLFSLPAYAQEEDLADVPKEHHSTGEADLTFAFDAAEVIDFSGQKVASTKRVRMNDKKHKYCRYDEGQVSVYPSGYVHYRVNLKNEHKLSGSTLCVTLNFRDSRKHTLASTEEFCANRSVNSSAFSNHNGTYASVAQAYSNIDINNTFADYVCR